LRERCFAPRLCLRRYVFPFPSQRSIELTNERDRSLTSTLLSTFPQKPLSAKLTKSWVPSVRELSSSSYLFATIADKLHSRIYLYTHHPTLTISYHRILYSIALTQNITRPPNSESLFSQTFFLRFPFLPLHLSLAFPATRSVSLSRSSPLRFTHPLRDIKFHKFPLTEFQFQ